MDEKRKKKKKRKEMNAGFKPNNYFRVLCHPVRKG